MASKNADSTNKKGSLPVVFSKDEMNLAEFPFTLLSRRAKATQKTIEINQQVKDQEGRIIKQEWVVTGSDKYGLPLAIDEDVYIALMQLYKENDFRSRRVHLSRYELIHTIMGKEITKGSYDRVEEAFNRLVSVTIVSKNAFWDNKGEAYVSKAFHLFDSYSLYNERLTGREREQQSLPRSNVVMSEFLFDSIKAGYIKNLDTKFYFSLDTPLSKRLYRYLDKKRYQKTRFEIGLLKLAALLPVQDQYISQIKRRLKRPHNELIEKGFLKSVTYKETKHSDGEKIIYAFPRVPSLRHRQKYVVGTDTPDQLEISEEKISLRRQLIKRGITETVATGLVEKYPTDQIEKQIEVFDCLLEADSPLLEQNPAGFLRRAVEDNYMPPQEYAREAAKRETKEAEEARIKEAERKRQAAIEEELVNWDKIPPAKRVKGFLDFWIEGERLKRGNPPTVEEIEAKIKEQVSDLPRTAEERRQYLAREHTLEKYF